MGNAFAHKARPQATAQDRGHAPPSLSAKTQHLVHDVLHSPGKPLDSETRAYIEPRFRHDFSKVRVHDAIHEAAKLGTSGLNMPLPYFDAIQRSFGRHDISGVAAHTDTAASAAARTMAAAAFTTGDHVAFARRPSLHTAAHEVAHVIQQRGGIQLAGGVGTAGDRHEQHAEAVANLVVQGRSSEDLLDVYNPRTEDGGRAGAAPQMKAERGMTATQGSAVQMKSLPTAYGTFEDVYYGKITNADDKEIGCEMYVRFTPGDKVDATKVGLVQIVKGVKEGKRHASDATKDKQSVDTGVGKDFHVDMWANSRSPVYGTQVGTGADAGKLAGLKETSTITSMSEQTQKKHAKEGMKGLKYDGMGQFGYRMQSGATWKTQAAELDDWPVMPDAIDSKDSGQVFETTALALDGTQKETYYGSVQWGWQRDAKAAFSLLDFKVVSMGAPSANFMAAAGKWNLSKTSSAEATIPLPTVEVYTTGKDMDVLAGADKIKLPAKTRVRVVKKGAAVNDPWQVSIVDGPNAGKQVSVDGTALSKE